MAIQKVKVFAHGFRLIVFPAVVVLREGDEMQVINTTDEELEWKVPKGPFSANAEHKERVKKESTVKKAVTGKARAYDYEVIGKRRFRGKLLRIRAKGNSDPMIIIDL